MRYLQIWYIELLRFQRRQRVAHIMAALFEKVSKFSLIIISLIDQRLMKDRVWDPTATHQKYSNL
jgi:hypothetical protein